MYITCWLDKVDYITNQFTRPGDSRFFLYRVIVQSQNFIWDSILLYAVNHPNTLNASTRQIHVAQPTHRSYPQNISAVYSQ